MVQLLQRNMMTFCVDVIQEQSNHYFDVIKRLVFRKLGIVCLMYRFYLLNHFQAVGSWIQRMTWLYFENETETVPSSKKALEEKQQSNNDDDNRTCLQLSFPSC
jgi:hypothetical protein